MPSLDTLFGIHEKALYLREQRSQLLAANLANVDTPNYKARDIDFDRAIGQAQDRLNATSLARTHGQHFSATATSGVNDWVQYRMPTQNSVDGNTVEADVERAKFTENTLRYQATLEFLNSRIKGIQSALKGE